MRTLPAVWGGARRMSVGSPPRHRSDTLPCWLHHACLVSMLFCFQPSVATTAAAFDPEDSKLTAAKRRTSTVAPSRSPDRRPAAFLGLGTSHYDGRHSEGNRFISDDHL